MILRNGRQIPLRHVEGLEMCNIIGLVGLITKVKLEDQRSETKAETRSCAKPIYLGNVARFSGSVANGRFFPFTKIRELQEIFVVHLALNLSETVWVNKPFETL